jgi:hypothetical protein
MRILLWAAAATMLGSATPAAVAAAEPKPVQLRCVDAQGVARTSPLPRLGEACAPDGVKVPPGWTWVAGATGLNVYTHSALGNAPPGLVKVWVLYSFDAPKTDLGKEHRSAKTLEFHSCANGTYATSTTIKYSQPFGEGEVVESSQVELPKQLEIPPDTAAAWVWKSVCSR